MTRKGEEMRQTLSGKQIVSFGDLRTFEVFRFVGESERNLPCASHTVPIGPYWQKQDAVSFLMVASHEGQFVVTGPKLYVDEDTPVVSAHQFSGFWPLDCQGIPASIFCEVGR